MNVAERSSERNSEVEALLRRRSLKTRLTQQGKTYGGGSWLEGKSVAEFRKVSLACLVEVPSAPKMV